MSNFARVRNRLLRFVVALAAVACICSFGASPLLAEDPYNIYMITPMTGIGAFIGKNEAAALSLIQKNVNKSGGIRGRQINFVVQDDQSNPAVSVQLLNGLIANKVPFVLGSSMGAMCSAMLPLVDKNGPVTFCFSGAVHPPKGSYMFFGNLSSADLMSVLVRYFRERGFSKLALIVTNDTSGQDGERALDIALAQPENKHLTVVSREHFNGSDLSVAAQLSRIKASGAQALIAYAAGTPFGTVLHGLSDSGFDIPVGTTTANLSYEAMKQFSSFLPKDLYFVAPPAAAYDAISPGPLKKTVNTFLESAKAANLHADIGLMAAWDPALIVVSAIQKYGFGITTAQVKDYIDKLNGFPGVYGIYDFRFGSRNGLLRSNGIVVRWDAARDNWVPVSKFGGGI